MKAIFKFPLGRVPCATTAHIMDPEAKFLHADQQIKEDGHAEVMIWAEVDIEPEAELIKRYFSFFPTGHRFESKDVLQHISTFVCPHGLVWHIYEVYENEVTDS